MKSSFRFGPAMLGAIVVGGLLTGILVWRSNRTRSHGSVAVPPDSVVVPANRPPASVVSRGPAGVAARAAEIISTIESGADVATGRPFQVGPDGALVSAPTRRVGLLDELIQLDPKSAAAQAERILAGFTSADEWAVALRAWALANPMPEGRAFLAEKFRAMLGHEPWRREPSVGFLEAFDVAVHVGGTGLLPELTQLVRQKDEPQRAVAHAAYLALDRLVLQQPAEVLTEMQQRPDLMEGREQTRANFFARADAGDPTQRALLESYLLDPRRAALELETFAGLFPNANYMISHNLLTRPVTPDGAALRARDAAALRTVEGWLRDPRFARRRVALEQIQRRLEEFVRQADGPR